MIGGGEGVEGEDAQGGRAVNQDEIKSVLGREGLEEKGEALEMVFGTGDFNFGAAEVHFAGDQAEAVEGGGFDLFQERALAQEGPVGAAPSSFSRPRPLVALAWGSKSTRRTRRPTEARHAARLMVVVVLPTPPFDWPRR